MLSRLEESVIRYTHDATISLETEVRQQQGIILDPLKVTLDTSSVVDVNPEVDRVKDGPMEGIPQEEYPVQSNLPELNSLNLLEQQTIPVEGDRIPESALNIVPQKAAAIEACAGAYATEPTACVQRLISTPRPLTPTFYHSVAEIVSFPSTPPSSVVEIHPVPSSPLEDMDSQPNCPAPVPIEAEETTAQDITLEDMVTEKTSSQEMIAPEVFQGDIVMGMTVQVEVTQDSGLEDMITEEATPMEMTQALVLEDMVIEEAIPREIIQEKPLETMVTEEVAPAEIIDELTSKDIIMEEATSTEFPQALASEEMVMEDAIPGRTTQETIHENMVTEEDSPAETVPTKPTPTTPSENMGAHQCNEYKPQKLSPLAAWYAKPPHGKEIKRSIVPDHYGERRCSDKERHRIQGDQQSVYPADVSLDRFRAEVRLFPPVRLQLMLNYYVACRIRELDSRSAGIEGNYLERVIRTPEQCRRDYSFDAHWRNYASSRPYDQRQPPFTFHEAIDLVTGCLAAALPEGGQLVRRAEQDFRKELEMEVRQRHEALEEMSWLSSWVCPRRKPPHLAEDPLGQMQKFSRDYARRFLSHLLDEDSLRYYCLGEDVGSDTKKWIQGVRTRSDFISIRHPQTPWCIRRQSDFWMCTKWCHDDMKNCQSFMQFTNTWFKECMAYDSPVPVVKKLYVRFDRDRCDWLKHYAGEFPHREQ